MVLIPVTKVGVSRYFRHLITAERRATLVAWYDGEVFERIEKARSRKATDIVLRCSLIFCAQIIFDPNLMFEIQEYIAPQLHEVREVYNITKDVTAKVMRTTEVAADQQRIIAEVESRARERTRRVISKS